MILDSWTIALFSCAAGTVFLGCIGGRTAWRVLRDWDSSSDSERQIRLEQEIWLSATMVEFGLAVEMISLFLLVFAADHYATLLKGAMCATGALTVNPFGVPTLLCKLAALFVSFIWIVLHRLDIGSESYPLVRCKYLLLLVLFPLLGGDALLLCLYLFNLDPEIITSCCGVLFSHVSIDGYNLLGITSIPRLLCIFAVSVGVLVTLSSVFLVQQSRGISDRDWLGWLLLALWVWFYCKALVVITAAVSPYVYAMPHHRCPFDLLQPPYLWTGLPLYLFLHGAVLAGTGSAVAWLVRKREGLGERALSLHRRALVASIALLFLFLATAAWKPAVYLLFGGEQ